MEYLAIVMAAGQYATAMAVFAGLLTTLGQGNIAAKAIESMARQPEAKGSIQPAMILGLAMAETNGIYGLLIAFLLLFFNPFVNNFVDIARQLQELGLIG